MSRMREGSEHLLRNCINDWPFERLSFQHGMQTNFQDPSEVESAAKLQGNGFHRGAQITDYQVWRVEGGMWRSLRIVAPNPPSPLKRTRLAE